MALLVLLAFAAHGLHLLNDGRVADDWMYVHWMANHEWETFRRFHWLYNNLPQALPLWPLGYFPNVAATVHAVSFVLIGLCGIAVYRICSIAAYFDATECFLVAAMSVCYPAFMWHASAIYSVFYNLPVLVFLVAAWLALRSESSHGMRRYLLQSISILLFFYSFHAGSLLVFFYGVALVHCYVFASVNALSWKQAIVQYCARRVHFLACPLAFRAAYQWFSHPYIWNELQVDPASYAAGFRDVFLTISLQARDVFGGQAFWLAAVGCLIALAVARAVRGRAAAAATAEGRRPARRAIVTLCFGVILLVSAVFAYVATGKTPYPGATAGYSTRALLLAQVPIAVILVGLLQFVALHPLPRMLVYPLVVGLIASSVAIQVNHNLKWLRLGVLDRSFELHLSGIPAAKDVTYFIVVDLAYYMGEIHHPFASLPFQIADVLRPPAHVFVDLDNRFDAREAGVPRKNLAELVAGYTMGSGSNLVDEWRLKLPTEVRQSVLVVCPGPGFQSRSANRLVATYQYYRWIEPEALPQVLEPLLRLHLLSTPPSKIENAEKLRKLCP